MNSKLHYTIILWLGLSLLACNPDDKKEKLKPDTDLITENKTPEDYHISLQK